MSVSHPAGAIDHGLYARVLRRGLAIVLAPALIGALLGFGISLLITPAYAAHTRILITPIPTIAPATGARQDSSVNLDTEAQIVTGDEVAKPVAQDLGLENFEVRRSTSVTVPPNSAVLLVTYTDSSPQRAVRGADGLAASYLSVRQATATAQRRESQDQIGQELSTAREGLAEAQRAAEEAEEGSVNSTLAQLDVQARLSRISDLQSSLDAIVALPLTVGSVIEPARAPSGPSIPNRGLLVASLGALGLLIGLSLALLRERANSAITSADDVRRELGLPLLGRIDANRKLVREEQVEHVRRQMLDLVAADAGCEIVGQDTALVHAAVADLDPPPVPRPPTGERYALLVLHPDEARSAAVRTVMENVLNRGFRVIGAIFLRPLDEPEPEATPASDNAPAPEATRRT